MATTDFSLCLPFVGGIIERGVGEEKEVLIQTRWKPERDPVYSGCFEFPAGVMDKPFENVYDTLAREIREETGLTLTSIVGDSRTKIHSPKGTDSSFAFRPFCCTQQLIAGKPWVGFIFICEVAPGEPTAQATEVKDIHWIKVTDLRNMIAATPEKFFTLEIAAWDYYFSDNLKTSGLTTSP